MTVYATDLCSVSGSSYVIADHYIFAIFFSVALHEKKQEALEILDLPQVDFMNFRVEYVRPLFRSQCGQVSDKVARGQLVSLEGFSFAFSRQK